MYDGADAKNLWEFGYEKKYTNCWELSLFPDFYLDWADYIRQMEEDLKKRCSMGKDTAYLLEGRCEVGSILHKEFVPDLKELLINPEAARCSVHQTHTILIRKKGCYPIEACTLCSMTLGEKEYGKWLPVYCDKYRTRFHPNRYCRNISLIDFGKGSIASKIVKSRITKCEGVCLGLLDQPCPYTIIDTETWTVRAVMPFNRPNNPTYQLCEQCTGMAISFRSLFYLELNPSELNTPLNEELGYNPNDDSDED